MRTKANTAVAAGLRVDVAVWDEELDGLMTRIEPRFARAEAWEAARSMIDGLTADLPRKNCWTIAEHVGDQTPDRLQNLLSRASWDDGGVRADVRDYLTEHLCSGVDPSQVVLIVDETGDAKKGTCTVGVQRQYSGTCGRIENCQLAVMCTLATPLGHGFIDTALYLPECWTSDEPRRAAAGIPEDVKFATKPELARAMLGDALDAGVPAGWVTADEVYGDNPGFRKSLEERRTPYVAAVSCDHHVALPGGTKRVDELAEALPDSAWQIVSAGAGAKGQRLYDWALIDLPQQEHEVGGYWWVLIRRSLHLKSDGQPELAFYRCWSPRPATLHQLIWVAGMRWRVEENIQTGKGLCGLDEHQVRTWGSWHRWATLVICAGAHLATIATAERASASPSPDTDPASALTTNHDNKDNGDKDNEELIPLTRNEICHIRAAINRPHHSIDHIQHWSNFRRRHQARARRCHYRRREQLHADKIRYLTATGPSP